MPLFLFSAIQAAFLPGLAALIARGDDIGFRRRLTRVVAAVGCLAVAGFVVFVAAGPELVRLFYGPEYQTTRTDIWPLAAGAGLFMIGTAFAQTLIALRSYLLSTLGWVVGSATFLVALLLPLRLEQRVGLAFLLATLAAAVCFAVALRHRLTQPLGQARPAPATTPPL
jgi:O-antigen/teichoic acid export membrane protein